ncbi:MAG: hypothetical protein AAF800_06495 [Planctomycetota bacterium]
MSDDASQRHSPDGPGGQEGEPRKRRRKRRRSPNQPAAAGGGPTEAKKTEAAPTDAKPRDTQHGGYRGRNDKPAARGPAPTDQRPGPPPPNKNKRRKPRTKQCVHCFMPCTTIHRVRLDHRKQWVFICDQCWAERCVDNPHYEYGGLWVSGRVVKPESQHAADHRSRSAGSKPAPAPRGSAPAPPAPPNGSDPS